MKFLDVITANLIIITLHYNFQIKKQPTIEGIATVLVDLLVATNM